LVESLEIAQAWPRTTIVVTSRADLHPPGGVVTHEVDKLSESEWVSLATDVAEGRVQIFPSNYPVSIREAVTRPLYAILLGVWVRDTSIDRPNTPAALVRHLVDKWLERAPKSDSGLRDCIRSLARLSVEAGGHGVRLEQVADGPALRAVLLETGIVDIDPGSRVTFPLAIFAEWFAGQALLLEPGLLSDATFDRLLRWQYALVQAVGAATHEQAKPLLEGLVCSAPALAGWVIHSAIYEESVPASTGIRTGDEWAESIARAMDCWRDAMGVLASATTPFTESSEPAAIGTRVAGSMLTYGWSRRSGRTAALPEGARWFNPSPDWRELGDRAASDDSLFEWLFTWKWVSQRVEQILKDAWMRPATEALQAEYEWHLAQIVVHGHGSGTRCDPVPLEELQELIDIGNRFGTATVATEKGTFSVRQLRDVVARHRRCGHDAVPNPWPCFDRRSHSIPDSWTAERRLERLRQVSDAALEGYAAVIQRYLPAFRTQLNTRRLMPVRLRGYQHEDANAEGRIFGRFNEMWYLEPLPMTQSNEVRWVKVDDLPSWDDLETDLRASFAANRPDLPLSGVLHGGFVGFDSSRPAMNLLVTLLWEDFKVWNWVSGVPPNLFNFNKERNLIPDTVYWVQPDSSPE